MLVRIEAWLRWCVLVLLIVLALANATAAQESDPAESHPGHAHESEQPSSAQVHENHAGMNMSGNTLADNVLLHANSGTDATPASTPAHMLMKQWHDWTWMLHGEAFLNELQESGPRGDDKLFSTDWLMGMAQRRLGAGTLTLRTMLSLDPATVTARRYPELFQQGETAFGKPIIDGQHPHDFIMEIGALYDWQLRENALVSFYAAPQGDPAMGPVAYPHRISASENPIAPLGHHLQDSTHIANDVITTGFTYRNVRLEASGFHGREPNESRWDIDSGAIDSWSTRITINSGRNWSGQYSIADLHSPEQLNPQEDLRRMTASVTYNRSTAGGNWASMLLWGRNQSLLGGNVGNSFLFESTLQFARKNYLWTRIENVDRTNELLLRGGIEPPGFHERYFARVQAYTAGYDREVFPAAHLSTAIGAQLTFYGVPPALVPLYGQHPVGAVLFLRVRSN